MGASYQMRVCGTQLEPWKDFHLDDANTKTRLYSVSCMVILYWVHNVKASKRDASHEKRLVCDTIQCVHRWLQNGADYTDSSVNLETQDLCFPHDSVCPYSKSTMEYNSNFKKLLYWSYSVLKKSFCQEQSSSIIPFSNI